MHREQHEIAKEPWFIVICDRTQAMNCFLEVALRQATIPKRCASHFATFTNKKVTTAQREALSILGVEVHLWEIIRVDVIPLDVNVSQVWCQMCPGDALLVEHLSELDGVARVDRGRRPPWW